MQIKLDKKQPRFKVSLWLSLTFLAAGVGTPLTIVTPTFAQVSPRSQPRSNQPSGSEGIFYEMKGDDMRICRPKANSSKPDEKECAVIGKGYTFALRMGNDLYGQGNITNAENIFRQLIARYPKEAEAYYKLGTILLGQQESDSAIAQFRKAIELNPQHAKAHNDLGAALATLGQMDAAINEWREAVKINADYADALNNLGLALLQEGQKEKQGEAVTSLKKARELFIQQRRSQQVDRIDRILRDVERQSTES